MPVELLLVWPGYLTSRGEAFVKDCRGCRGCMGSGGLGSGKWATNWKIRHVCKA